MVDHQIMSMQWLPTSNTNTDTTKWMFDTGKDSILWSMPGLDEYVFPPTMDQYNGFPWSSKCGEQIDFLKRCMFAGTKEEFDRRLARFQTKLEDVFLQRYIAKRPQDYKSVPPPQPPRWMNPLNSTLRANPIPVPVPYNPYQPDNVWNDSSHVSPTPLTPT